jgi:hypothetical protein
MLTAKGTAKIVTPEMEILTPEMHFLTPNCTV